MSMASEYHAPVLLQACLEGLNISPDGTYVDVTFGGGGHSRAILEKLGEHGHLISFDRDRDAWANAALLEAKKSASVSPLGGDKEGAQAEKSASVSPLGGDLEGAQAEKSASVSPSGGDKEGAETQLQEGGLSPTGGTGRGPHFTLVRADFRWLKNYLRYLEVLPVDGLLADLGVSSHQFDTGERGFSFRFEGPLDMRMDHRATRTAAQLISELDQQGLTEILRKYGEVDGAHRVARQIANANASRRIRTTQDLVEALKPVTPRAKESSFLAQVFQALRIAVNDELASLEALLKASAEVIKPGGRLVIMSYHSLEDRLVKNYMRSGDLGGVEDKDIYGNVSRPFKPLSSKAIQPTDQEIAQNPRARSARLRIAERI
jgi:16S rRNA (cytosine1402-N4)-methyltransferase